MRAEPRHGFCASSCASQYGKKSHFCIDFRAHNVDIFTCMRVFYILTQIFYHTFFFLVFPFFYDNKKLCFILCVCVKLLQSFLSCVCVCVMYHFFLLIFFVISVMTFWCLCVCLCISKCISLQKKSGFPIKNYFLLFMIIFVYMTL